MKNFLILFFVLLFVFTSINLSAHLVQFKHYGDFGGLDVSILQSKPFSRWFLGSTLINDFYWKVWKLANTVGFFQNIRYVPLFSSLVMCISTIIFIKKFGTKLYLILPVLSPLWIMFSLGYDEYYPFITPFYLFTLIWLFIIKKRLNFINFAIGGSISALLPLLYIGFLPIGILILLYLTFLNPRKVLVSYFVALTVIFFSIYRFWPWGFQDFFTDLLKHMNFGDLNTTYTSYIGKSAGKYSPNFTLSYIFSLDHFKDLSYMLFFGGGLAVLILLLSGIVVYIKKFKINTFKKLNLLQVFAIAIVLEQIYYFVFMIPKMGPIQDIDLFFSTHITFAFFAGLIWGKLLAKNFFS